LRRRFTQRLPEHGDEGAPRKRSVIASNREDRITGDSPGMMQQAISMLDDHSWKAVLEDAMIKPEFVRDNFGINRPIVPQGDNLVSIYKYKNFG